MPFKDQKKEKLAHSLKNNLTETPVEFFEPLTFGELKIGDKFISMPMPGDNNGHGGFLGTHHVFIKTIIPNSKFSNLQENALRVEDGILSRMPDNMIVIKVK